MTSRKRSAATLGGERGADTAQGTTDTAKRIDDCRENQGIATRRNADQRAPTWAPPPGTDAADDLHRALASWTALLGRAPDLKRGMR